MLQIHQGVLNFKTHYRVLSTSDTVCLILQTHQRVLNTSDSECFMLQTHQRVIISLDKPQRC